MLPQFHFSQFEPEESLRLRADLSLDQILELAPDGTIAVARLKKDNEIYSCSVDLYTKYGPLIARATQATPLLALQQTQKFLQEKLLRLKRLAAQRIEEVKPEKLVFRNPAI